MKIINKKRILVILLFLFSCLSGLLTAGAHATSKNQENVLYDQEGIKIVYSYTVEENDGKNSWTIKLNRATTKENKQQRFRIKMTDTKKQRLSYPKIEGMEEMEEWLVEESYSSSETKEMTIQLPEKVTELFLIVQLDEKLSTAKEEETSESILPNDLKCHMSLSKTLEKKQQDVTKESFQYSVNATMNLNLSQNIPLYTNKQPQYLTDNGTYPKYAWKPTGQENILNHQGGSDNESGWDGNTGWNTGQSNLTDSYIRYGQNDLVPNESNLLIRKMAMATEEPDEFKIRLNVRGQTNYQPGMDVVLLLDNSGSLRASGSKQPALNAVKNLIDNIVELKENKNANIRVGAHVFASYTSMNPGSTFPISDNPRNWESIYGDQGYGTTENGETFTQRALIEANDLFKKAKTADEDAGKTYNRKKLLLVLTDGSPTLSWKPTAAAADSSMYYDQVYVKNSDSKNANGTYKAGSMLGVLESGYATRFSSDGKKSSQTYAGQKFTSHITMANSAARDVKEDGVEIHTLALNLRMGSYELHTREELIKGLYLMSSKKSNAAENSENISDYFFHDINTSDLNAYINDWYKDIAQSVSKGVIDDPLGDMVDLVDQPTVTRASAESFTLPSVNVLDNDRRIKVENLNLEGGQEVQIEYTVKLRTDDPSFNEEQWYQTNCRTTLAPTPERSPDLLDFGVPSVRISKAANFVIPVEKRWQDSQQSQPNYYGLRPDKVVAVLQEKVDGNWVDRQERELSASENWKADFDPVSGGEAEYRVIEKSQVKGYGKAAYSVASFTETTLGENSVTLTNTLMTSDYSFTKVSHDEQTPFTGTDLPRFKVTRRGENGMTDKIIIDNLEPKADGTVKIENLALGSYSVQETHVPAGHSPINDFIIEVTENGTETAVTANVSGQGSPHIVSNKLKDFTLILSKVDNEQTPLNGATFKLTGPNNYNKTLSNGTVFTFNQLKPGSYKLKETSAPQGYKGLEEEFEFTIETDGNVVLDTRALVSGSLSLETNTIEVTVKNKPIGSALPTTGGRGVKSMSKVAIAFVLFSGVLGAGGLIINWRNRRIK